MESALSDAAPASLLTLVSARLTGGSMQAQTQPCQLASIRVGAWGAVSLNAWLSALDELSESPAMQQAWARFRQQWHADIPVSQIPSAVAHVLLWWWLQTSQSVLRLDARGALLPMAPDRFMLVLPVPRHPPEGIHLLRLILQRFNQLHERLSAAGALTDAAERREQWLQQLMQPAWNKLSWNTVLLRRAADQRGIPWWQMPSKFDQFGWGSRARRFLSTHTDQTGVLAQQLAKNKHSVYELLRAAGLPVARQGLATTVEQGVALARTIGFPVVVKPAAEDLSGVVSVNLRNEDDVRAAFDKARERGPLVVESYVTGREYRITVVHGQIASVHERTIPTVTGDGRHTVAALINAMNADPRRSGYPHGLERVPINSDLHALLAEQGWTMASVPPAGQVVRLHLLPLTIYGGTPVDRSSVIHPENAQLILRAVRLVGLDIGGVDFIITDIARRWRDSPCAILEVNSQPLLVSDTLTGEAGNLFERLLGLIFKDGDGRIPVVAFGGESVALEAAQQLHDWLISQGRTGMGVAGRSGAWLDREILASRDISGAAARDVLLVDPATELALIQCGATGLLHDGHPCDRYAVSVLLEFDRSGEQHSQQIQARAWTEMARRTTQTLVVNVDDDLLKSIAAQTTASRIIRLSTRQTINDMKEGLPAGGMALAASAHGVQWWDGQQLHRLAGAAAAPSSLCRLAAWAGALALGMRADDLFKYTR